MEINLLSDLKVGIYHYFVTPCQIVQFRNMTVDESVRTREWMHIALHREPILCTSCDASCAIGKGRRRAPQLQIYSGRRSE